MTTCPSCGRTLADTVKDCPGCGHDFAAKRRRKAEARLIGGAILIAFLWWLSKTKRGIRVIVFLVIVIGIFVIIGSPTSTSLTSASCKPLLNTIATPSDASTPKYGDDPYQVSETNAVRARAANNTNSAASEPKSSEVLGATTGTIVLQSASTEIQVPPLPRRKPEKSWDRPHIYIQLADESQRKIGISLRQRLLKAGYVVEGIENSSGDPQIPTQASELRFFASGDAEEAERIAKEFAPVFGVNGIYAKFPEGMPYVSHARQYEIWVSSTLH